MSRTRSSAAWRRGVACAIAVAWLAVTAAPMSAWAVLGGDEASVQADQERLAGVRRQGKVALRASAGSVTATVPVHEIGSADGSIVREYLTDTGVVFAVSWATHFKPDLAALFGAQAPVYAAAASQALQAPGIKRHVVLQRGDLVVQSSAHLNTFVGKAYVKSLVPAHVDVDQLR